MHTALNVFRGHHNHMVIRGYSRVYLFANRDRMYRDYGNHADANLLPFVWNIDMLVNIRSVYRCTAQEVSLSRSKLKKSLPSNRKPFRKFRSFFVFFCIGRYDGGSKEENVVRLPIFISAWKRSPPENIVKKVLQYMWVCKRPNRLEDIKCER